MTVGFAMCGSFCTYAQVFPVMEELAKAHTVIPIFSPASYVTDSRFGTAQSHIRKAAEICGKDPLYAVSQVEPSARKSCWMPWSSRPAPAIPWRSWPIA